MRMATIVSVGTVLPLSYETAQLAGVETPRSAMVMAIVKIRALVMVVIHLFHCTGVQFECIQIQFHASELAQALLLALHHFAQLALVGSLVLLLQILLLKSPLGLS